MAGKGSSVVQGIGDDAAVLRVPVGHEMLVTTDFTIENVHFRREWHPPKIVGWRCLTRGLSDIAAMGGAPVAAFLSLAAAGDVPQRWVDEFLKGLLSLGKKWKVPLAGGDLAQAESGIQADIVVVGSVPRGKAVLRSGARVGQHIYVTGKLGGSAAALARLRAGLKMRAEDEVHFRPLARVDVGQWLRAHRMASAMIDVSDGLSTDLEHICVESSVGAEIDAKAIPRVAELKFALHGGDDYELLFTSSRKVPAVIEGVAVTQIGRIVASSGMKLVENGKIRRLEVKGWEHFRG